MQLKADFDLRNTKINNAVKFLRTEKQKKILIGIIKTHDVKLITAVERREAPEVLHAFAFKSTCIDKNVLE